MNKIGEVVTSLFKGRLGRLDYFTSQFTFGIMLFLIFFSISLLNSWIGIFGMISGFSLDTIQEIITTFTLYLAFISYFTFIISIVVRRGHDIGWSAGFSILMFMVSLFILIPALFLLFKKSNISGDKYGKLKAGTYFERIFNLSQKQEYIFKEFSISNKNINKIKIIAVLVLSAIIIFISFSYYRNVYIPEQNLKNGFVVVKEFKCPDSHPIKANLQSMVYHTRNSSYYSNTNASNGKCFDTAENAKKQGFRPPFNSNNSSILQKEKLDLESALNSMENRSFETRYPETVKQLGQVLEIVNQESELYSNINTYCELIKLQYPQGVGYDLLNKCLKYDVYIEKEVLIVPNIFESSGEPSKRPLFLDNSSLE